MNKMPDAARLKVDIKDILYKYIAVESFSSTANEHGAEEFWKQEVGEVPYFKANPDNWGLYAIPDDYLDRNVLWAMVKGKGSKTVVCIHHYDVVPIEDFQSIKEYAFKPEELKAKLLEAADTFAEDVAKDLKEDTFTFGRGACDMKGGGSIQLALLRQYSEDPDFEGNMIVIGVPDEENLSAGMRGAIGLLNQLKEKYGLEYKFMFNSEPHQRKDFSRGMFSMGSIGKLMPFVYVRGFLAHAGKSFEGLNPVGVMGDIVSATELNMDLADTAVGESAPGPTWLYLKDSKVSYDVSMPLYMYGCLSVLTLIQTPQELLEKIRVICEDCFGKTLDRMNAAYARYLKNLGQPEAKLPWKNNVKTFGAIYAQACSEDPAFEPAYKEFNEELQKQFLAGTLSIIDYNCKLVDYVFDRISTNDPTVIYGLVPPYYPHVANLQYEAEDPWYKEFYAELGKFSEEQFGLPYDMEYFYTGISDLSYIQMKNAGEVRKALADSTPLFGGVYDVPLEGIEAVSMPVMNIGPWGKDFHKMTERVNTEDLLVRTPAILHKAITDVLCK